MTIEVRKVTGFDQVRFKGPGILKISQRDEESLTIHAPSYVMKDIEADVVGKELRIGYRSPKVVMLKVHREIISYSLSLKDLKKLRVTGLGRVLIPDLDNDNVRLELSGLGQVVLDHLTADRLEVKLSGAGQVKVIGDVEAQSVVISGAGHYDAPKLVSDFAQLKISGAGKADVSVSTDLDVNISGAGQVTYAGYPEIVKRVSGTGSVTRRRRASRHQENGEDHG
jgi:hypothetical protein